MEKITFPVRTFLIVFLLLGSSLTFLTATTKQSAAISITGTVTNVSCFGQNDGAINVTISGGTGNYSYSWDSGETSDDINGLAAGPYTLTVTDENGSATKTIEVTQPNVLSMASSTIQNVSCYGLSDGSVTSGAISGGTAPYQYKIDNGVFGSSDTFPNLSAGTYLITARDANGCEIAESVTVLQPAALSMAASAFQDVSCNGLNDGFITAGTVTGGTQPYQYKVDNGTYGPSDTFQNLSAGTYLITARDANGCEIAESVTVSQPAALSMATSTYQNVSCNGLNDGFITAGTVTGGTQPYQYKVDNGTFTPSGNFPNLSAGTYLITARDANGCEIAESVTVSQPAALSMAASAFQNVSCNGLNNGSITAGTVTGGNQPYQYKVDNGTYTPSENFPNLSAGTYLITARDANGCEIAESVTVSQPSVLSMATSTFQNVSCNGLNDGFITAGTVTGGTQPYQYKVDNETYGPSDTFQNLAAGTYVITARDANGCEITESVTVSQPAALSMTTSTSNPVSCNGSSDGSITLGTVTGGTSPYQYKLNTGNFGTSNTFSNLSAGTYSVTAKDANGCEISESVTVIQPAALTMAVPTFTPVTCNGAGDAVITAGAVSGGNGTFEYSLNNGSFQSSNIFSGLSAGTYSITVKDSKGCTATSSIDVTEPEILNAVVSFTDITCNSTNDGTISITGASGGYGTYQYSINNGSSWQDSGIYTGLSDGTYPILIRDKGNSGCVQSLNTHLTISRPFVLNGDVSGTNISCNGGNDGSITISNSTGGYDSYQYSIDGVNWQSEETFNNLRLGSYKVQIRDAVNPECVIILDPAFNLTEPQVLSSKISSKTDILCNGYATGSVTALAEGGTAPYTYSWGSIGPGATKTDLPAGTYSVTVTDANGCSTSPLSVTLTQPETFVEITTVRTTSGCYQQNNGTATVEAQGGTGAYTYLWSNGQNSKVATGLAPGNHSVTITDANGCSKTKTVTVSTPTQLQISGFLTTETTSFGSASGTATAQITGGTPNYTFQWSNAQTGQTARDLAAGTYTVTVTDANGCTATRDVTIIDSLTANILPMSICEDRSAIRISYFEVDGGTAKGGTAPYTYSWNFGEDSLPETATGSGRHRISYEHTGEKMITLTVTDIEGRTFTQNLIQNVGGCFSDDCGSNDLGVEDYFIGDSSQNKITSENCNTTEDKYIYINLPTEPHRYSLYVELIYTVRNLSDENSIQTYKVEGCFFQKKAIPDIAQTFLIDYHCGDVVTVEGIYLTFQNNIGRECGTTQGNGNHPKCYSTNNEATVRSPLYAVAFPNNLLCNGAANGIINTRSSGGTGDHSFELISAIDSRTVIPAQDSNSFTGLVAGKYKVIVKDDEGESFTTAEVEIKQPLNPLNLSLDSETNITCFMGTDGTATVKASGGTPNSLGDPYIYIWDNGQTTATATNLSAGNYNVRVIDANGCEVAITVAIEQPAEILAVAGPDQILDCGTTSTQLQADFTSQAPEGEPAQVGVWTIVNGPAGASFANINDPQTIFSGAQGTYTLRWTVPCGASDDVKISIGYCSTLDFDGVNDHIDFGNNFNLPENFTLEAWIKQDATTATGIKTILSKRNNSNLSEGGFDLIVENNIPKFRWNSSSIVSQHPIGTDRWYHIAVIKGGAYEGLYVDGIKTSSDSTSPGLPTTSANKFLIGAAYDASTPNVPVNYFHGWMEEVRIWNTALTLEQLHFMMNQKLQNNGGQVKGLEIPLNVPGNLTWDKLSGYYQLGVIENGFTLGETAGSPKGKLINITTIQERTAPLPYISTRAGTWFTDATWLRPQVWDPPGSIGVDGVTPISWNIARISHNISSGGKNIKVLGLLSKQEKLTVANPGETLNERNSGQSFSITHYLQLNGIIDLVGESQLIQTDILKLEDVQDISVELPQSITSVLDESSTGYIERDQQGTANSYNYNYWSSPVSLQGAANNSTHTIATVMFDGTNSAAPRGISFGAWHEFADGAYSTPRKISNYWLWKFRGTANVYSEWKFIGSTGTLNAGEGYTMKGTSGQAAIEDRQNYVFKGKPNNGTIPLNIQQNQNYLLGNPYPSAIDVNKFILDNLNSADVDGGTNTKNVFNGAVYFWDHFAGGDTHILLEYIGGYATRNLIDGVPAISNDYRVNANDDEGSKIPGQYIPVAQGFFINSVIDPEVAGAISVDGGDVLFKNSQRVFMRESSGNTGNSVFLRPEEHSKQEAEVDKRSKIRLDFRSPMGYYRQILVGVDANASNEFDLGYDALMNDYNVEDMYWIIGGREFVIQGVSNFGLTQVLPLGLRIDEEGEIMLKINELKNIGDEVNIFLKDKLTNTYYDLRESEARISLAKGEIIDRFEIVFKKDKVLTPNPDEETNPDETPGEGPDPNEGTDPDKEENPEILLPPGTIDVIFAEDDHQLRILNPDEMNIQQVEIFNLIGQKIEIFTTDSNQKQMNFQVQEHPAALYVVKVFAKEGMVSKNILIMK